MHYTQFYKPTIEILLFFEFVETVDEARQGHNAAGDLATPRTEGIQKVRGHTETGLWVD